MTYPVAFHIPDNGWQRVNGQAVGYQQPGQVLAVSFNWVRCQIGFPQLAQGDDIVWQVPGHSQKPVLDTCHWGTAIRRATVYVE
jgi:hypothetical protein